MLFISEDSDCMSAGASRLSVAVHESAHAVVAAALGYAVTRCRLAKIKRGEFHGHWTGCTTARGAKLPWHVAAISVAGQVGESQFDPNYADDMLVDDEIRQAIHCATVIAAESGRDRDAVLQQIVDFTANTLQRNERTVRSLADELCSQGRIGPARLAAILSAVSQEGAANG